MNRRFPISILVLFLFTKEASSQKFSSKYFTTPLLVNPANTGKFIGGTYRFAGISRTEKNVLYQDLTSAFSVDAHILKSKLQEQDKAAIGIAALSETDRYLGLKNSYLLLSTAFFKGIDAEGLQQLAVGFQVNVSSRKLEPPTFIFEDQLRQWESTGFVGVYSERRAITVNYLDFNAGISYQNIINYNVLCYLKNS